MTRITRLAVALLVLTCVARPVVAQPQTGTIVGSVTDQQGGALPGVTVTVLGRMGAHTTVTEENGRYRVVGLSPDEYRVRAELPGFVSEEQGPVSLGLGKTLEALFALKVAGITETVEVSSIATSVDATSAATDSVIRQDVLFNQPIFDSGSVGLKDMAPGIWGSSYGSQGGTMSNALLLDGVDTRDPRSGAAWVAYDPNLIQEVQVGGLGAPAEYGGFTGAVVNTIVKSGGNAFSGLVFLRGTTDDLASDNVSAAALEANPSLADGTYTVRSTEYTAQLGGPVVRDKAFFFGNISRFSDISSYSSAVSEVTSVTPRLFGKVTVQPSPTNTFVGGLQYDQANASGLAGLGNREGQTRDQERSDWVWNAQWRKVFGARTFLEAKFAGYTSSDYIYPIDPSPPIYDGATSAWTGGGGLLYYTDRKRNQVNATLTHYAERFGSHALKFGAEIERGDRRLSGGPFGPAGFYVYAWGGVPYYQISYSYDLQADNRRESAYAQDQWQAGRLTLNLGLRLDRIRGYSPALETDIYQPDLAWGPRLGAAYDVTGKGAAVVRAFWGRYYEGTADLFFINAAPGNGDWVATPINPDGSLGTPVVLIPGVRYGMADEIGHPRVDEFNVSWEQQFARVWRLTATAVRRRTSNIIGTVIDGARWEPVTLDNALTGGTFTGYRWANAATTNDDFLIRNAEGYEYIAVDGSVIGTAHPWRDYKALIVSITRPFRNCWSFQGSYVLSRAEGTVENGETATENNAMAWLVGSPWNSPNQALINSTGRLVNSGPHEIKALAAYQIPKVEVMVAGAYYGLSGRRYTPYQQYPARTLNLPDQFWRRIFLEPRGGRHLDFFSSLSMRVEKVVQVGIHRVGLFADIDNPFNWGHVDAVQARVPSRPIGGHDVAFEAPTAIQWARQIYFGGRWSF